MARTNIEIADQWCVRLNEYSMQFGDIIAKLASRQNAQNV
jgi:hypothetical protein